ncbi:hypothetical protein HUW51_17555 [Adhaeribacter swui]|uniref:FCP1 homology domain-containing protein n=1 Tax=Adhaeribacter swui TaxID=2086471 RepID=A0A7G7GBA8_9BACT|nr:HAD domain-containing protein [Adhaeribacter swui]QNF34442.1 hypothetical protein HUW51_17555 [Adhaeribacter swui]
MKVIFLDIDGVLNPAYHMHALHFHQKYGGVAEDAYGYLFCPHTLEHLAYIVEHTHAKLVISSTWRKKGLTFMQDLWHHRGLPGEVVDITPVIDNIRGEEIAAWLQPNEVENFIIIDDENYLLPNQVPYLVQTDMNYGLKLSDAQQCIALLNQS